MWYWHKNRHACQQNQTEDTDKIQYFYYRFLTKRLKIHSEEKTASAKNGGGQTG